MKTFSLEASAPVSSLPDHCNLCFETAEPAACQQKSKWWHF